MENQKETGTSTDEKIPWNRAQLASRKDSFNTLIVIEGEIPDGRVVKTYLTLPECQQIIQDLMGKMTAEEVLAFHKEYNLR